MTDADLNEVVSSLRPALKRAGLTEEQRAEVLYRLVREFYDFVKFDVYGPTVDAAERMRIGQVLHAALPPVDK